MAIVYLLLGSNLGNKADQLNLAKKYISEQACTIMRESACYETEPWGFCHPSNFYNQALEIETSLTSLELIGILADIEKKIGRKRNSPAYEARIIDIDIIFYENEITEQEPLRIPHPKMHLRKFVLIPLNELIPDFIHPVLNKKLHILLHECDDTSYVMKVKV